MNGVFLLVGLPVAPHQLVMVAPDSQPQKKRWQSAFAMQAGLVIVAVLVAGGIVLTDKTGAPDPPVEEEQQKAGFDMLAYMDQKVGSRESKLDVRCWSSMSDLQQFITQCKISPEAKGARTRLHAEHLEKIWREAAAAQRSGEYINAQTLLVILNKHYESRRTDNGVKFDFNQDALARLQMFNAQAEDDYEKTIETWRLLQHWATGHIDPRGRFTLKPQFDQEALELLYSFLRSFDLAILRKTGEIAKADRLSEITDQSVVKAFDAVRRQPD